MAGFMAEKWREIGRVAADDMGDGNELYWYCPKVGAGNSRF